MVREGARSQGDLNPRCGAGIVWEFVVACVLEKNCVGTVY